MFASKRIFNVHPLQTLLPWAYKSWVLLALFAAACGPFKAPGAASAVGRPKTPTPTLAITHPPLPTASPSDEPVSTLLPSPIPSSVPTATNTPLPSPSPEPTATSTSIPEPTPPAESVVLIAVGDIATCSNSGDERTWAALSAIWQDSMTLATLGDHAYEQGSAQQFQDCYAATWGSIKDRTRPSPGNHEYGTAHATGYFEYFGLSAGAPNQGYYSYDLGAWHIIALNSNCGQIGGCRANSPQVQWLAADLAAHSAPCTLAYWHHPRFSSGMHGNEQDVAAFWDVLYEYGADVVLGGHDHNYERFGPQNPAGELDLANGIRQFVVGTGGRSHRNVDDIQPNSEVRNGDTFGVLKMTLYPTRYAWKFIPEAEQTFTDAGTGMCH